MREEPVHAVGHRRADGAAGGVGRAEHEVVDEELRAAVEQVRQGLRPLVGLEAVLLLDLHPGQLATPLCELVTAAGVLLLEPKQLLAGLVPLLARPGPRLRHRGTRPCGRPAGPPAAASASGRVGTSCMW